MSKLSDILLTRILLTESLRHTLTSRASIFRISNCTRIL